MAKSRREKMKEDIRKRTKESYENRESSGMYGSVFKSGLKSEGVNFWNASEGFHTVDILLYPVGENHPDVVSGKCEPGETFDYKFDFYQHSNVGPNQDRVICLARTYGLPCPICEHLNRIRQQPDYDDDDISPLIPSHRTLYNVIVYDSEKEEDKGVQLWEVAYKYMEKHLMALYKDPRTGNEVFFASPDKDEGKTVCFTREGQKLRTDYSGHKFEDRDYDIPDELLDSAYVLDEMVEVPTYEEIYKLYWGEEPAARKEEDSDRKESKRSSSKLSGRNRDSRSEKGEDSDSKPGRSSGRSRSRRQESKKDEPAEDECLGGGIFGEDIDQLDYCNDCEVYDDCAARADEIEEEKKARRRSGRNSRRSGRRSK